MDNLVNGGVSIAIAIVGVALLAVLVSRNAQTPQVIQAGGQAFANSLSAATGPVTGAVTAPNVGGSSFGLSGVGNYGLTGSGYGL